MSPPGPSEALVSKLIATLLKPFSPHQLLGTVKEVLRATGGDGFGPKGYFPLRTVTFSETSPYEQRGI